MSNPSRDPAGVDDSSPKRRTREEAMTSLFDGSKADPLAPGQDKFKKPSVHVAKSDRELLAASTLTSTVLPRPHTRGGRLRWDGDPLYPGDFPSSRRASSIAFS